MAHCPGHLQPTGRCRASAGAHGPRFLLADQPQQGARRHRLPLHRRARRPFPARRPCPRGRSHLRGRRDQRQPRRVALQDVAGLAQAAAAAARRRARRAAGGAAPRGLLQERRRGGIDRAALRRRGWRAHANASEREGGCRHSRRTEGHLGRSARRTFHGKRARWNWAMRATYVREGTFGQAPRAGTNSAVSLRAPSGRGRPAYTKRQAQTRFAVPWPVPISVSASTENACVDRRRGKAN
mmetsp:Transcript_17088/g.46307  ORF Transcript_17088/g.46307 Transcript_17088/m.46307 type:complete len:240 (+) Transcript_17088:328-1047(+)